MVNCIHETKSTQPFLFLERIHARAFDAPQQHVWVTHSLVSSAHEYTISMYIKNSKMKKKILFHFAQQIYNSFTKYHRKKRTKNSRNAVPATIAAATSGSGDNSSSSNRNTNFTHAISERLESTFQLNHIYKMCVRVCKCLLALVCAPAQ